MIECKWVSKKKENALTGGIRFKTRIDYAESFAPVTKTRTSSMLLALAVIHGYCIVLYLPPVLNPMSYDGARVLESVMKDQKIKPREKTKMTIITTAH